LNNKTRARASFFRLITIAMLADDDDNNSY
jgi:hypothetical protein